MFVCPVKVKIEKTSISIISFRIFTVWFIIKELVMFCCTLHGGSRDGGQVRAWCVSVTDGGRWYTRDSQQ